jgi:hypothetical protein
VDESDNDRLDRLVQLILEVNRIYRNKKRRRKTKNSQRLRSPTVPRTVNTKLELDSDSPEPDNQPDVKPVAQIEKQLATSPGTTGTDSQLLLYPQYQSSYNNSLIWMMGHEQQPQYPQWYAYQQLLPSPGNPLYYGISLL